MVLLPTIHFPSWTAIQLISRRYLDSDCCRLRFFAAALSYSGRSDRHSASTFRACPCAAGRPKGTSTARNPACCDKLDELSTSLVGSSPGSEKARERLFLWR